MRLFSKNLVSALVGAVAFAALSSASHAGTISVFSTGVDNGGNLFGGADQHYSATGGAPTTPYYNSAYVANGTDSQWIGGNGFPASVDYSVHFTLSELGTHILTGSWAVDNDGEIFLNNTSLGIVLGGGDNSANYNQLHTFFTTAAQSALFLIGDNILTFRVADLGNPGALRTAGLAVTTTPIPPAILLFMTALGGMGFFGYRSGTLPRRPNLSVPASIRKPGLAPGFSFSAAPPAKHRNQPQMGPNLMLLGFSSVVSTADKRLIGPASSSIRRAASARDDPIV